jgi:putative DNA primase/helicase
VHKDLGDMSDADARAFAREAAQATPAEAVRDRVIEAVLDAGATFWLDERKEAFATVLRDGRIERHAVRSRTFKAIVRLLYGDANPVAVGRNGGRLPRPAAVPDQALSEALGAFEAMAQRGPERRVGIRIWRGEDGAVWLDLGRADWALVRIAPEGWYVVTAADVPLVRTSGLAPLPLPEPVGRAAALNALRSQFNVGSEHGLMLLAAWLVCALFPEGPYAVLALDGEQGSAKTTVSRKARRCVDPHVADIRPLPKDERDLIVAARNARVLAYDNVSHLKPEMADAICRVATGAGWGERELYTNGEEYFTRVCNPVLLNGIPSLLGRADLADRALAVTLVPIADEERLSEAKVWAAFDAALPGILALLLDALALVLRDGPGLSLARLPRMADFAKLACAAAPAFGWTVEDMLAALERNWAGIFDAVVEADQVAKAVQALASERVSRNEGPWFGTSEELLELLNQRVPQEQRERGWPRDPTRFSMRLRRAAPALRKTGIEAIMPETGGRLGRMVEVRQRTDKRSERSERSDGGAEAKPAERWNARNADGPTAEPEVGWSEEL